MLFLIVFLCFMSFLLIRNEIIFRCLIKWNDSVPLGLDHNLFLEMLEGHFDQNALIINPKHWHRWTMRSMIRPEILKRYDELNWGNDGR